MANLYPVQVGQDVIDALKPGLERPQPARPVRIGKAEKRTLMSANHTQKKRENSSFDLANKRLAILVDGIAGGADRPFSPFGCAPCMRGKRAMQDILWIGAVIGLLALTLAYARLCEKA